MNQKDKIEIIGPCSKYITGKGWVTKVPIRLLNELGFVKINEKDTKNKQQSLIFPICYVHLLDSILKMVDNHNLYLLLLRYTYGYALSEPEIIQALDSHAADVAAIRDEIIKPLDDEDKDTRIVWEEANVLLP